jgi:ATP-dependent DNA helicase RecG
MKTKNISEADFIAISAKEESHFFDLKAIAVSGKKVQKVAVAFANADGGDFIIGIADVAEGLPVDQRWQGTVAESFNAHVQALSEIKPSLQADYLLLTCEGKAGSILQITIEKSPTVHKTAADEVYVRKGAQSLKLDEEKIKELSFGKGVSSFEDYLVPSVQPDEVVDSKALNNFLASFAPQTNSYDFAFGQNLIDRSSFEPKVAGILLFSDMPSAFMPRKCAVRITRYRTKEDDPERDQLESSQALEGPLYNLIKETVAKVSEIMSGVNVWTTTGLQTLQYPPEAIWEIIANAFIHRDYSISDDVQIHIYDDRILVMSPGKLPGYVTPKNILSARFSRNSKIVRTLAKYPDPPNKDLGEGLNTAFQKMKDWKLRPPKITEVENYVHVVIPHIALASATDSILEFLEGHQTITNRQARDITGIRSENAMKNEFYKLRDAGELEMVPELKGSSAAWRLKRQ